MIDPKDNVAKNTTPLKFFQDSKCIFVLNKILGWTFPFNMACHLVAITEATIQGLYSLSVKTSYCQILWSLEAMTLEVVMIILLWNLPVKFYNDWQSLDLNLTVSETLVNRGQGYSLILVKSLKLNIWR